MHPGIRIVNEGSRGCGNRKLGGLYLVFDGPVSSCGKLPIPFEICPCCGEGIRFSRSPKWIEQPERLWNAYDCKRAKFEGGCSACPMSNAYESGPALLIWVGKKYYETPRKFVQESIAQGISRRIQSVPRGFEVGKTWVLLAHEQAVEINREITDVDEGEPVYQAGIFGMMKPSRIEIIVTGNESDEEIEKLLERGLTPVKITKPQPEKVETTQEQLL